MKFQNRIKLIGLICIVIGSSGLAWGIITLVLPQIVDMSDLETPDIPPHLLNWSAILSYTGILVNAIPALFSFVILVAIMNQPWGFPTDYIFLDF